MNPAIRRVVVLDQQLPAALPVQRVEVRRITIEPHTAFGAHIHNGPVFGNIVSGSAIYQQGGDDEPQVLHPGDVFYEPAVDRISRFDTADEAVTFLAYFPLTAGQEATLDLVGE
ncbi:quercetin dioxygenase-like cupin family protein [Kribbella aluminosa]|uniref:Quercetin dioxygenase-like cupin family protein n=1 Tax=Kribbella aluminosa TaxID=416017 RepID=A0ABS4UQ27_9ACTN|nr:cupin domain-containing protein [Kribbella aluminosa]MBP2353681.1 quercetin dioxygenase-like cupin family protein [Kribbella aluminosa]